MTATNVIVQSSSVSLITDGAYYDERGVVREIASKVAIAPPSFRMALAVSGRAYACRIADLLRPASCQQDAMAMLPSILQATVAENAAHPVGAEAHDFGDVQIFAAIWSDRTRRPEAWAISSGQSFFGPAYVPGTLVEIEQAWAPEIACGGFDPATFDRSRDARRVLAEQRTRLHEIGQHLAVGGFGEITTVHQFGVAQTRLCDWPDRIGEKIAA